VSIISVDTCVHRSQLSFSRIHGCPDCFPARTERHAAFVAQLKLLQTDYGFEQDHLHVKWACQWNIDRANDPDIAKYLKEHPLRPLTRLDPQSAVKAALNESYDLYFNANDASSQGRRLLAADLSSLFPYCAIVTDFPVKKYYCLVGEEIDPALVSFQDTDFFYDGQARQGLLQVRVLPPRDLFRPFLLTKVNDQSVAVLCRTCAENMQQEPCEHDIMERALTDTWTSPELAYAVRELGYKVLEYFELMLYTEKAPILKTFTTLLAFHKIRFAALPGTVSDLQLYCDKINEEMQFQQVIGKLLEPRHLSPSKLMRQFFKKALVCWIGNFSANLEKRNETKFLDLRHGRGQKDQLFQYACAERILSITPINKNIVQVTLTGSRTNGNGRTGEPDDAKISRKSCATIGGFVTSVARIVMYKHMRSIASCGGETLKIGCDSLYYTLDEKTEDPLQFSESFGFFKNIYPGKVTSLTQLGVNNYSVMYQQEELTVSQAKCSGLVMSSFTTNELTHDVYSQAVYQLVNDKLFDLKSRKCQQVRKKIDAKTVSVGYVRRPRSIFSRNILSRRIILKQQDNFVTRPYGYVCTTLT
jgi:hypothetical protein